MGEWVCILRPPRATFIEDATEEERSIMSDHFHYLEGLLAAGKLVLAGPSLGPLFGITIFEAETEEEARRIVADDPAVSSGLQTPELSCYRVSLLRGRD